MFSLEGKRKASVGRIQKLSRKLEISDELNSRNPTTEVATGDETPEELRPFPPSIRIRRKHAIGGPWVFKTPEFVPNSGDLGMNMARGSNWVKGRG